MAALAEVPSPSKHQLIAVPPEKARKEAESLRLPPLPKFDPQSANAPQPHPELAGRRLRLPGDPAIYLVDPEGLRHHVPDPYTYNRIFRDWNNIYDDPSLYDILDGGALSFGASVIRGDGSAPVYFVSGGTKRWITSPPVMDKCNFNWPAGGDVVGPAVVAAIPTGANWTV